MLKSELIKILESYDDEIIVIGDHDLGWSNVDLVKFENGMISIMPDYERPFSDDK